MTTKTQTQLEVTVFRMKEEILSDVRELKVPVDVKSFSELHDYVDANEYGGFCEDDGITDSLIAQYGGRDEDEGMPQGVLDFMNAAQSTISVWIADGGLRKETEENSGGWQGPLLAAYGEQLRRAKKFKRLAKELLRTYSSLMDERAGSITPLEERAQKLLKE